MYRQEGLVIIELMMAVLINMLLIAMLFSLYSACLRSIDSQAALVDVQMNANAAISLLREEVHRAGYIGCARLVNNFPIISYFNNTISPSTKLVGGLAGDLTIRYMTHPGDAVLEQVNKNQLILTANKTHYKPDDILMISDCHKAEIFKISDVKRVDGRQYISTASPLHGQFNKEADVGRFMMNRYFIGKTNRMNRLGNNIYALFVEDRQHRKMELVEGLHQMDLTFTTRVEGHLLNLQAKNIVNWEDVEGVSVDLVFGSLGMKKPLWLYAKVSGY